LSQSVSGFSSIFKSLGNGCQIYLIKICRFIEKHVLRELAKYVFMGNLKKKCKIYNCLIGIQTGYGISIYKRQANV